ncbi:serine/threonine-protein kinase [Streptomyces sp. NPDC004542]|uniref:serine/threonine-protein kinase n=1 Tax=Streptomyces sp. NPDC004542 TaxID=3154281 RepID=UPI0033ABA3E9
MPPESPANQAAALRQAGASPLGPGDPRRVGPYAPLGLLGSGGMGRVYLARPATGGSGPVAVKVIRPEYAEDARFRRRFEREASVHARVRTPHTARLCGTGFQDELLWMATEYLPGLDLAEAVRGGGALETPAVWRLVAQLGQALADLSAAGIVHRDLKPSNVLLSLRGVHVIDFGISKAADASAITGTGNRVGTPAYMSPEHLREGRCDTASDVFSTAGALVYAATGHAPFGDGTGVDVMHRVAFEEPDPELLSAIAGADPALGSLLSRCLAKEPERRPTPRELIDAAGAYAATDGWPEPLRGELLARQEAYETLRDLPVGAAARSRPTDERPAAAPPAAAAPVLRPAAPSPAEPQEPGEGLSAVAPCERSAAVAIHGRARKTRLAVAVGAVLCAVAVAVAVGGFLLTRQDAAASGSSPGTGSSTAFGALPGQGGSRPASHGTDATSSPAASGEDADGAPGGDVRAPRPAASGSAGEPRPNGPSASASAAHPSSPAGTEAAPSSAGPRPEPSTPAWISDCTFYYGNGRTRAGDSGKRVSQVQCMLTKRGYDVTDGVDGEFGAGTESAVRGFQSDKGLDADGVVGRATWVALRSTD